MDRALFAAVSIYERIIKLMCITLRMQPYNVIHSISIFQFIFVIHTAESLCNLPRIAVCASVQATRYWIPCAVAPVDFRFRTHVLPPYFVTDVNIIGHHSRTVSLHGNVVARLYCLSKISAPARLIHAL